MGLSGVKNKTKLAHDPNNTNWSKSTTNFGHKILLAQGWKPGEFLGAENAAQAEHYTAANASHIRVALREENMGIGVQVGKGNAETFGLSMFSGLLGRLNGKSDAELEKNQKALRDVELGTFHARKYGSMNFVSGGLLVGDKMEFPKSTVLPSKKRKAEEEEEDDAEKPEVKATKTGGEKEAKSSAAAEAEQKKSEKKERKERKEREAKAKEERRLQKAARKAAKSSPSSTNDSTERARLKAEKRARKEERRARKEEKRARRAAKDKTSSKPTTEASASSSESDGTATPPEPSTVFGGRHAVRQRYIMQKRRAHMDPQALKEIFMLQAKAAAS